MANTRGNPAHGVLLAHYFHELPEHAEQRLSKIFQELDLDGNGRIDVHDLSKALHKVGVHKRYAEVQLKFVLLCLFIILTINQHYKMQTFYDYIHHNLKGSIL